MSNAEEKAKKLISGLSTEKLLDQWELTSILNGLNIPTVRGWLMEEIEKRNPKEFDRWLDLNTNDEDLRSFIIK